jgi:heme-degrading monooxygenase HmoA
MSDFHDCLTHDEIAHVTVGEFQPGKFEQACRLYDDAVSTYGEGFKAAYLLREKGTDRGIAIVLWKSEEQMNSNEATVAHQAVLRKMAPLFAATPQTTYYEVVSEIHPQQLQPRVLATAKS